ncbi:hypothetical protein ACFL56_03945, partial [Candidatus Margulisiibacteriota bacterium]
PLASFFSFIKSYLRSSSYQENGYDRSNLEEHLHLHADFCNTYLMLPGSSVFQLLHNSDSATGSPEGGYYTNFNSSPFESMASISGTASVVERMSGMAEEEDNDRERLDSFLARLQGTSGDMCFVINTHGREREINVSSTPQTSEYERWYVEDFITIDVEVIVDTLWQRSLNNRESETILFVLACHSADYSAHFLDLWEQNNQNLEEENRIPPPTIVSASDFGALANSGCTYAYQCLARDVQAGRVELPITGEMFLRYVDVYNFVVYPRAEIMFIDQIDQTDPGFFYRGRIISQGEPNNSEELT